MIICNKAFKPADRHGIALNTSYTFCFTLLFLRTNSAADSRKGRSSAYNFICLFKLALSNIRNKFRDGNINRASIHTRLMLTIQTALCFRNRSFSIIAECNLFKILISYKRLLVRHWISFHYICLHFLLNLLVKKITACFSFKFFINTTALHRFVKINKMTVKFRTVNTGKLCFSAYG